MCRDISRYTQNCTVKEVRKTGVCERGVFITVKMTYPRLKRTLIDLLLIKSQYMQYTEHICTKVRLNIEKEALTGDSVTQHNTQACETQAGTTRCTCTSPGRNHEPSQKISSHVRSSEKQESRHRHNSSAG